MRKSSSPTSRPAPAPSGTEGTWRRRQLLGAALTSFSAPWLLAACGTPPGSADEASPAPGARLPASAAGDALAYRLANRVSWGATDAELDRVRRLGPAGYIDQQLRASAGPLPPEVQARIDGLSIQRRTPLDLWTEIEAAHKTGEALPDEAARKAAQEAFQQAQSRLAREAATRHLLRALYSPDQLQAQMQWFWFNHFNVHQYKGNIRVLLGDYEEQAIRPHVLGRFRDLLGAVTVHPAMLRYLDNEQNAVGRLNENLGRELLELHTLGVDGGYTQRDVQELARVLTGHGVNFSDREPKLRRELSALYRRQGCYEFNPARHDFGDKQLLGRSLKGRGAAELDEVLDWLAAHPSTARFVSRKIARQLLADEPPPALLDAMAAAWQRSDGRIDQVLGVLLRSPEFTAPGPGKFKDPVHYVVSAVRACYGDRLVQGTAPMQGWLNRMGQGLYNHQTPDGYPSNAAAWSSSGQMAGRLDIARILASGSAGLFRPEEAALAGGKPPPELPAFPQLARPIYWQVLRPLLAAPTRQALDGAASAQDWNTLYLSAPDFMYC
jgi:uncharacterized protein (DUF1800 family)